MSTWRAPIFFGASSGRSPAGGAGSGSLVAGADGVGFDERSGIVGTELPETAWPGPFGVMIGVGAEAVGSFCRCA